MLDGHAANNPPLDESSGSKNGQDNTSKRPTDEIELARYELKQFQHFSGQTDAEIDEIIEKLKAKKAQDDARRESLS